MVTANICAILATYAVAYAAILAAALATGRATIETLPQSAIPGLIVLALLAGFLAAIFTAPGRLVMRVVFAALAILLLVSMISGLVDALARQDTFTFKISLVLLFPLAGLWFLTEFLAKDGIQRAPV